jgi:mannose-6-phosphate isomerase-like protein (cupin superfamily)
MAIDFSNYFLVRLIQTIMNREKIKAEWAGRGFSCGLWIDPPGKVWADFVHDTDELVMVIEGEQEFEMNGKSYRPRIEEELLIPAGIRYTARNIGAVTSKWLYGYKR